MNVLALCKKSWFAARKQVCNYLDTFLILHLFWKNKKNNAMKMKVVIFSQVKQMWHSNVEIKELNWNYGEYVAWLPKKIDMKNWGLLKEDGSVVSKIASIVQRQSLLTDTHWTKWPVGNTANCVELTQSFNLCLSCLTSLVATPASLHPSCATDSEEDTVNGGMHTFNQTHMRKAFQLMNDLRRCVSDSADCYEAAE